MFIDQVNLNHLRIFETVYRTRSMTQASKDLFLTQSGVSQHMKALEDTLGVKLFDRVKQRLVPTRSATVLFEKCSQGLNHIEDAIVSITGQDRELKGSISLGMPIEFGNNLIMPLLAEFNRKHPLVRFRLTVGFAVEMNEALLNGSMDFAFVDDFWMDSRVQKEKVYDETLRLCASHAYLERHSISQKPSKKDFEKMDYVEYQDQEPLLRKWFLHHYQLKHITLNVKATVMDVQGVAQLILNGMGAGILPNHLVRRLEKEGRKLAHFKGCGHPLKNAISIASLSNKSHSLQAETLIEFLRDKLKLDH